MPSGAVQAEGELDPLERMLAWGREVFGGEPGVVREETCVDEGDA